MAAKHLSSDDFQKTLDQAKSDGQPVFVDFYAEWCGPCKMAAPVIDKLADEYDGKAVITKLNVDENPDVAGKYGVMSIPTVLVFKDGEVAQLDGNESRVVGFVGEDGYREVIEKAIEA